MQRKKVNQIVGSMSHVDFSGLKIPMIVVYEKPLDFPNEYVARVFDGGNGAATNTLIIRISLQEIREDIMAAGFTVRVPRAEADDPHIVESWM